MQNKIKLLCLSIFVILGLNIPGISQSNSGSWKQYRGKDRSGISNEKLMLTNPELIWKHKMGSGFSELVVSGASVYTMFSEKTDSISGFEYLVAYDENTGNEKWRVKVDSIYIEIDGWGDGPKSTSCH